MPKILVVDDEKEIRQVIVKYLQSEGYLTIEAENGVDAVMKYHDEHPDLLILDLNLPDISGEKVCESIRQSNDTPIIMLTAKVQEDDRINGLALGADDYVLKPFSPKELVMRVKAILRRTLVSKQQQDTIEFGKIEIDEQAYVVKKDGKEVFLTPIEFKILVALSKNPGRTFSREQLITFALGYEYDGLNRTIDSHIKNLRQKIESDPGSPKHIRTIFGVGYKFKE
ncbi:MAG: response regulator transcription factor [Clostridiales bacterium]|nr:response regulator transcription factor [Clostridiales bacterium]